MRVRDQVRAAAVGIAAVCVFTTLSGVAAADTTGTRPTVTPATGGRGSPVVPGFTAFDPAVVGYTQSEFVLTGTAGAYAVTAAPDDGKHQAVPTTTAPYATRVVVMRPRNPARFNGTVVVEWLNVSGGADAAADWMQAHTQLIREGFAWVGVSAQRVGVDALRSNDQLRGDAVRYAGLSHPGDGYGDDIFSQAGRAIRDDRSLLGDLRAEHLIAIGESQSAIRLVTYIDAIHPLAEVYDGFLVHSRAGGAPIRDDLGVPVLVFQTETDVAFSNLAARQPDTSTFRLWEVAGTAHYDLYGLSIQGQDTGDGRAGDAVLASMQHPTSRPSANFECGAPINTGPAHYVLDAAVSRLNRWVTKGVEPPVAPRLQTTSVSPVVFATDADGNARGGIRTPAVDAPVATLTGRSTGGNSFCFLFGSTTPFTPARLEARYPDHGRFVADWVRATKSARRAGFLVAADARELTSAAVRSDVAKNPAAR